MSIQSNLYNPQNLRDTVLICNKEINYDQMVELYLEDIEIEYLPFIDFNWVRWYPFNEEVKGKFKHLHYRLKHQIKGEIGRNSGYKKLYGWSMDKFNWVEVYYVMGLHPYYEVRNHESNTKYSKYIQKASYNNYMDIAELMKTPFSLLSKQEQEILHPETFPPFLPFGMLSLEQQNTLKSVFNNGFPLEKLVDNGLPLWSTVSRSKFNGFDQTGHYRLDIFEDKGHFLLNGKYLIK